MSKLLFEPIKLRNKTIRNRIWVPPMCQYTVEERDGVATDWQMVHLGGFARGGAGAIIVEATGVTPEGRISPKDLGLWNDKQRDALAPIVDFLHSQGATAGIQLEHAGRKASMWPEWGTDREGSIPLSEGGWETVGPSPLAMPGFAVPRELDQAGIEEVVNAFAAAARRAVDAGFDMLEVHGAHGYLVHSFLSPLSNIRTDAYGGSLENRARFMLEVVDAMRSEIGEETLIVMRLSATDWTDGGLTIDDTVQLVQWLEDHGVDLVDVSTGGNVLAPIPAGPGYQVPFAAEIKRRTKMPTAAVGLITDPFQAEQILLTQQADVVLVGREMMRDPNFAIHAAEALGYDMTYRPEPYNRAYL